MCLFTFNHQNIPQHTNRLHRLQTSQGKTKQNLHLLIKADLNFSTCLGILKDFWMVQIVTKIKQWRIILGRACLEILKCTVLNFTQKALSCWLSAIQHPTIIFSLKTWAFTKCHICNLFWSTHNTDITYIRYLF